MTLDVETYLNALNITGGFLWRPLKAVHTQGAVDSVFVLSYRTAITDPLLAKYVYAILTDLASAQTTPYRAFGRLFTARLWAEMLRSVSVSEDDNFLDVFMRNTSAPPTPPAWQQAVASGRTSLTSADFVNDGNGALIGVFLEWRGEDLFVNPGRSIGYAMQRFDPAVWVDAENLSSYLRAWGSAQTSVLQSLAGTELDPFEALRLLFVLASLCNAPDQQTRRLASDTLLLPASSPEYPNDTLVNQLVYLALMTLVDPLGSYGWMNPQIKSAIDRLGSTLATTGPGTTALGNAIQRHSKILNASPSYPMVDPYALVGFGVRQTNALAAVNAAWGDFQV